MTDTLTDLLSELRARFAPGADVREVEIYLASRGYDARQIGEILAVFVADLGSPGSEATRDPESRRPEGPLFRVLGPHERGRFTTDAWGYLIALGASGTLSPFDREQIIERALMHTDGRVGLGELRALLESAGLDDTGPTASQTIH